LDIRTLRIHGSSVTPAPLIISRGVRHVIVKGLSREFLVLHLNL
jgi:hypothetical protein